MEVINWGLFKHPMNWLTIIAMVLIAAIAANVVIGHYRNVSGAA